MNNEHIDYVEFPSRDLEASKTFFEQVFGWRFNDYGPEYTAFFDESLKGGFYKADVTASTDNGSALIVFYSDNLEMTRARIEAAGGRIVRPVFSFPGGRRFHFTEPGGNELGVWSDKQAV